jgi:tetratricopeptide (TPR) repeat protein
MKTRLPVSATFAARSLGLGLFALVLVTSPAGVSADGGGGGGGGGVDTPVKAVDPDYAAGVKEIDAGQYSAAIPLLQKAIAREAANPDAHNWLAYAVRKNGDPAGSIPIYEKALALDPKHRGAHEYIGEAYLALDNLPKAKEHLARLGKLCFFPCSQHRDLKKAVEAYESSKGRIKPAASR